jgi:DNA-binding transcriptional ArsR family regulator
MLTELFTSKTRIRLLLKLFLNPEVSCYLRELAKEFGVAPNSIKEELDSLSNAGYLEKNQQGRSMFYRANKRHTFFPEIHSIVKKTLGIDRIVEQVMNNVGRVDTVYILDDYAQGRDTGLIDVLVVGEVDRRKIESLVPPVESKIERKIRVMMLTPEEFDTSRDVFMSRPNWKIV